MQCIREDLRLQTHAAYRPAVGAEWNVTAWESGAMPYRVVQAHHEFEQRDGRVRMPSSD
jgi:hypothetical protein